MTDAAGAYLFEDLIPGQYLVRVERADYPPDGMGGTYGTDDVADVVVVSLGRTSSTRTPTSASARTAPSATRSTSTTTATASRTPGTTDDYGIPGAVVHLYSDPNGDGDPADGALLATRTTDQWGHYFVGGLFADGVVDYVVVLDTSTTPAGLAVATPNPYPIADLRYGQFYTRADFGLRGTSSIGDLVWYDADGDGVKDVAEPGLADVTVQLWEDTNGNGYLDGGVGGDLLVTTTVTDAAGAYLFAWVNEGAYFVKVLETDPDLPAGVTATTADPVAVDIAAPYTDVDWADIGFGPYMLVGDRVWDDVDRNGVQDYGEPGLVGVTVSLTPPAERRPRQRPRRAVTTVTTAGGEYVFRALPAGDYTVDVDEAVAAGRLRADRRERAAGRHPRQRRRERRAGRGHPRLRRVSHDRLRLLLPERGTDPRQERRPGDYATVGETITYTYTLTNTGNVALVAPFAVADDRLAVPAPTIVVLAPGASTSVTASHTVTQADIDAGSIVNTASATAVFAGVPVTSNSDSVTLTVLQTPSARPRQDRHVERDRTTRWATSVSYELVATNTGNVTAQRRDDRRSAARRAELHAGGAGDPRPRRDPDRDRQPRRHPGRARRGDRREHGHGDRALRSAGLQRPGLRQRAVDAESGAEPGQERRPRHVRPRRRDRHLHLRPAEHRQRHAVGTLHGRRRQDPRHRDAARRRRPLAW